MSFKEFRKKLFKNNLDRKFKDKKGCGKTFCNCKNNNYQYSLNCGDEVFGRIFLCNSCKQKGDFE